VQPHEREARATLEKLMRLEPHDPERSWRAALSEVAATYRWAREAMAAAYASHTDAAFHQWRQAAHYHGLHLRALARSWPAELEGRLEVIEQLSELQRQDRDLCLRHGDRPEMWPLIDQRHQALRALARPLGRRLYGDPPGMFRRCLEACWMAWKEGRDADARSGRPEEGNARARQRGTQRATVDRQSRPRRPVPAWAAAS
jgi:hypothetical protein